MAYNTKAIIVDRDGKPTPQYFNTLGDKYEVLQGDAGAARQVLYDASGNPVSVVSSKLAVRAQEIEDALATLLTKTGFDAKADIKLSVLRDAITAAGENAKTLKDLHDKLTSLETEIQAIKGTAGIKKIVDTVAVQVKGEDKQDSGLFTNRPAANQVPAGFQYYAVDKPLGERASYSTGTAWEAM